MKLEKPLLQNLFVRGEQNGLKNLKKLTKGELKEYEPHVNGVEGIFVPQTGIVDYKKVAEKYGELIRKKGGEIKLNERVVDIKSESGSSTVITEKNEYSGKGYNQLRRIIF